jgi:hypothetical protein
VADRVALEVAPRVLHGQGDGRLAGEMHDHIRVVRGGGQRGGVRDVADDEAKRRFPVLLL